MLNIETVPELPPIKRGNGRKSVERDQIIEKLRDCETHKIGGLKQGREYNGIQQRIRTAAAKIGMKVTIRQVKHTESQSDDGEPTCDLFFEAFEPVKIPSYN